MGTIERIELIKNGKSVINELLKRVSDLELEVERYERIMNKLETHLHETYKDNMDAASEKCWTIAANCNYILNYIKELKENEK